MHIINLPFLYNQIVCVGYSITYTLQICPHFPEEAHQKLHVLPVILRYACLDSDSRCRLIVLKTNPCFAGCHVTVYSSSSRSDEPLKTLVAMLLFTFPDLCP